MNRYVQVDWKGHSGPDRGHSVNKNPVGCIWGAVGGLLTLEGRASKWGTVVRWER